jgi:RND superfamily putative drug exporter
VAILLDATVVRIVLLPALMLMLGDWVWSTPGWLDSLLPHFEAGKAELGDVHVPPKQA